MTAEGTETEAAGATTGGEKDGVGDSAESKDPGKQTSSQGKAQGTEQEETPKEPVSEAHSKPADTETKGEDSADMERVVESSPPEATESSDLPMTEPEGSGREQGSRPETSEVKSTTDPPTASSGSKVSSQNPSLSLWKLLHINVATP